MTDVEAVTIKNLLEDWMPYRFLQTTHSFVVVVSAEGVPVVLVRSRAQP